MSQLVQTCPHCDHTWKLPDYLLGRKFPCPNCYRIIKIDGQPDTNEPPVENRFHRWVLERLLGAGGMGTVHVARSTRSGKVYALKRVAKEITKDKHALGRFRREVLLGRRLNHPHIVHIHTGGRIGQDYFLLMDLVDGRTLHELIAAEGPIDGTLAARWLRQMASAMAHMAEHGLLHRDIKPNNIVINHDDDAVLIDLGLIKPVVVEAQDMLTAPDTVLGTPAFMPPEQIRASQLDQRADIYALGATFYYALNGRAPFAGKTNFVIMRQVLKDPPRHLSIARRDLPPGLIDLVMRMLEKSADKRPMTFAAIIEDLDRITGN